MPPANMEYSSKERSRELGSLLNAVERGNKRDAIDYTGGHLNEANLYKAPELYGHPGWKSGKKPGISLQKPSRLPAPKRRDEDGEMANVLTQFSLGNDGFLPSVKKKKAPQKSGSRRASREDWPQELTGSVDERALIEELDSRRFMLNRSQPPRPSKSWASEDEIDRKVRSSLDEHKGRPNRGFYSLNAGATKRDQFRDFKKFESNTLRKQDALERKVLSGEGAILQIEQKLMKGLAILANRNGTTFHRLQAHSEALDELVESSPMFGYVLRQVKNEYDNYLSWLLDNHPTQSYKLREQVNDLHNKRVSNPKQLAQTKKEVEKLEAEGKHLLDQNNELRAELKNEAEEAHKHHQPDAYGRRPAYRPDDKSHFDLADQLEDLHATILERMDKLDEMRANLHEEYVPSNVCQNLEQCLKDTEVEVQKLLKQNEIFSKNIGEMEEGISDAISQCDVNDRDKQKCWEKVNSTHVSGIKQSFKLYEEYLEFAKEMEHSMPTNLRDPLLEGESSEEEDEQQTRKWTWYIS